MGYYLESPRQINSQPTVVVGMDDRKIDVAKFQTGTTVYWNLEPGEKACLLHFTFPLLSQTAKTRTSGPVLLSGEPPSLRVSDKSSTAGEGGIRINDPNTTLFSDNNTDK